MFHSKNGWYFERTVDGGVHIVKKANTHVDAPIVAQCYLNHWEWASVIASVSYRGETGESFEDAKSFHGHRPGTIAAPLPENYDDAGIRYRNSEGR